MHLLAGEVIATLQKLFILTEKINSDIITYRNGGEQINDRNLVLCDNVETRWRVSNKWGVTKRLRKNMRRKIIDFFLSLLNTGKEMQHFLIEILKRSEKQSLVRL